MYLFRQNRFGKKVLKRRKLRVEDIDSDGCDDCSVGTDGFGPASDNDPSNDGTDTDADGICDTGDNCPEDYNPDQLDADGDNIGDVCDWLCGDTDSDDVIGILDVIYIINYKNGPDPTCP